MNDDDGNYVERSKGEMAKDTPNIFG